MKSPSWLSSHVQSLEIAPFGRYRSDCPVCNKRNTFSVTDDGVQRFWFCFHADCNVKGRTSISLSREHAPQAFKKRSTPLPVTTTNFEIPDTFVSLSRSLPALQYTRKVGCHYAYLLGKVDLRYDFKKDRVVFLVKDGSKIIDAVGRSLTDRAPKWYRYGNSGKPFVCGDSSIAFVVEDCASACCVSNLVKGVALLGTNLLEGHIEKLKKFDKVFVALDKDATDKAIQMVRVLRSHVPTRLVMLATDLKNLERKTRDDFIKGYIR